MTSRQRGSLPATAWLQALSDSKLEIHSARDAITVRGWLDSGNYALNWAMTGQFLRGYPLGHTVEIFGDPGTGKSFLAARAIAMIQKANGVALLDDTEGAWSLQWMERLGIHVEDLAHYQSDTVQNHVDVAIAFLDAYEKHGASSGLLVCDSMALLSTSHELDTMLEKRDMTKAGEIKAFFRIIATRMSKLPVTHLSTNHVIANIGAWGNARTTPGGGGAKFQSSIRLDLRSISKLKTPDKQVTGVICRVVVDKNRLAPPWSEVRFTIPFHQPISRVSGLIPVLIDLGILTVAKDFLRYKGKPLKLRAFTAKDKFLRQDEEAERLLDVAPEILEEADAYLASLEGQAITGQPVPLPQTEEVS